MPDRMRVEGSDDNWTLLMRPALDRPPDNGLVTQMKAVKIAERDDCSAEAIGYRLVVEQALHQLSGLAG